MSERDVSWAELYQVIQDLVEYEKPDGLTEGESPEWDAAVEVLKRAALP